MKNHPGDQVSMLGIDDVIEDKRTRLTGHNEEIYATNVILIQSFSREVHKRLQVRCILYSLAMFEIM